MTDEVRKFLAKEVLRQEKSLADLSKKVGKNPAYLQQFIKKRSPRVLPEDVRATLARLLNVSERQLGAKRNIEVLQPVELPQEMAKVPVMGEVRAGAWLEQESAYVERDEELAVVVPPNGSLKGIYGLVVVGDSMNKKCAPGSIVAVMNIDESGLEAKDGDIVVIERHRGGLVEVTLKRFRVETDGTRMLYPESTNPDHKPFPIDQPDSDYEVVLKAIATGIYSHL